MLEGFILIMMVFWVSVAFGTSVHASNNGKSPFWGVGVLLLGIFGLVGYAISLAAE